MTMQPSIIFMGTPDFAVPTLKALHASAFHVDLVVTQPDRPKGRGRRLTPPPVKVAAQQMGYEILQPDAIRHPDCISHLTSIAPDYLVVVAFGQILPRSILEIPKRGAVNVHASLLPRFRGPAPIQWAIIRGETETGITTMLMDQGVDTGDMLLKAHTPIHAEDTAESLHDRLAKMGAELLIQTLEGLRQGSVFPHMQNNAKATYAPMLKKEDGRLDWRKTATYLNALVRAMTPWPGAFCFLEGKRMRIYKTDFLTESCKAQPGTVLPGFPDELRVATGDGMLLIREVQSPSGKRLPIKDFLHGHPLSPGRRLE